MFQTRSHTETVRQRKVEYTKKMKKNILLAFTSLLVLEQHIFGDKEPIMKCLSIYWSNSLYKSQHDGGCKKFKHIEESGSSNVGHK